MQNSTRKSITMETPILVEIWWEEFQEFQEEYPTVSGSEDSLFLMFQPHFLIDLWDWNHSWVPMNMLTVEKDTYA